MIPRATYRLQFHAGFTFADARANIPYLAALGVSHIYASPITRARTGSTHGYDVVDPTMINPELGGDQGFRDLVDALRRHQMGIIIDIVPNHMGVAGGENAYWNDVLRLGQDSRYAPFFDIDWPGPLVLPILGATLGEVIAAGDLRLISEGGELFLQLYGEQRLPVRPGSGDPFGWAAASFPAGPDAASLRAFADAQHYRLVHWRTANDSLNWRRFFSINDLAAVRVEDPQVFAATHSLYFDLFRQGLIDGVRVDHVDGLADPASYCRALRSGLDAAGGGRRSYVVVEKILGAHEHLASDWNVDGTSGYDAMRDLTGLLHSATGMPALESLWREVEPQALSFDEEVLRSRQQMLAWQFDGQLSACVDAGMKAFAPAVAEDSPLEAITPAMLRRAMERLLWVFPVYRTYAAADGGAAADRPVLEQVWRDVRPHLPPGEAWVARLVLDWLAGKGAGDPPLAADVARRFQQLSAPVAAKGVEDTAFYRHGVLLSANDVGFAPDQPAIDPATFHQRVLDRDAAFPHAMLASATHDHKRGEDARARLAVLSEIPHLWAERWREWDRLAQARDAGVRAADRYQIMQGLIGAWPDAGMPADLEDLAGRMEQWIVKMLREAKLRSSWEEPDLAYEQSCVSLLRGLLFDGRAFRDAVSGFVRLIDPAAQANMLVQTCLKLTIPGVPDIYQGTELPDFSLVDPDNRRPVDYQARQDLLAGGGAHDAKLRLIARLLGLRRDRPELFADGDYVPVDVKGDRADHVLAFTRSHEGRRLLCVVQLRAAPALLGGQSLTPPRDWWGDSALAMPSPMLVADVLDGNPFYVDLEG